MDKSIGKNNNNNIQRFFNVTESADFSDIELLYVYLIIVFLYNVLYFIKRWFTVNFYTSRVISKSRYFELFSISLGTSK